jgi:DNA repair protein RecO (recombination protein O)
MPSSSAHALVLKRTKLGETDLIVSFLREDGAGFQAVAKGARKPGAKMAGKLELCSRVDVLLHTGRSLPIITEAEIIDSARNNRKDPEHITFSAPILDLLEKITRDAQTDAKLYSMSCVALDAIAATNDSASMAMYLAAALIKIMSMEGFRPLLTSCIACGCDVENATRCSFSGGGVLCNNCLEAGSQAVEEGITSWVEHLIHSRFSDLDFVKNPVKLSHAMSILMFVRDWCTAQLGFRLKSLEFVFNSGLIS